MVHVYKYYSVLGAHNSPANDTLQYGTLYGMLLVSSGDRLKRCFQTQRKLLEKSSGIPFISFIPVSMKFAEYQRAVGNGSKQGETQKS